MILDKHKPKKRSKNLKTICTYNREKRKNIKENSESTHTVL